MRLSAVIATAALAVLAVVGVASPAFAHNQLLSTNPQDGAQVSALPSEITLTFNDIVLEESGKANQIKVMDASCNVLESGALQITDNVVTQPISGQATGPVQVLWRVVSRDGHPVSGDFSFTVGDADGASASPADCADTDAAAPAPDGQAAASSPVPWMIGGGVLVMVIAGVVVLLATRSRHPGDR